MIKLNESNFKEIKSEILIAYEKLSISQHYINEIKYNTTNIQDFEMVILSHLIIIPENSLMFEFSNWLRFTGSSWIHLLRYQSQYSKFCDWSTLSSFNWFMLLYDSPQYVEFCDWSTMSNSDIRLLLDHNSKLIKYI